MRQTTKTVLSMLLAGIVLAGCSSKKDRPGSEPRFEIHDQRWNASWLFSSTVNMWQTFSTDAGPESMHSFSQTELLLAPAGHDPNGNLLVAVSFKRMKVANNEVSADSQDPLTQEDLALSDEDIAKGGPNHRIGMVKVLREVCKTTVLCRLTTQGRMEYLSGDDLEARAGGTIAAMGGLGLQSGEFFCAKAAVAALTGQNDLLPSTPVGAGARWHVATSNLSANTQNLPCDVALRLKSITDADGRRTANVTFTSSAGEKMDGGSVAGGSGIAIVSRQFDISGSLQFDLDRHVCNRVKVTERGKVIAQVNGQRRQKRFASEVVTTLTEAPLEE